jgi:hypothetical protein
MSEEEAMNEDLFNMEVRKFLKRVGVTSQREMEGAVRRALAAGGLKGKTALKATMTLEVKELGLTHRIEDSIALG